MSLALAGCHDEPDVNGDDPKYSRYLTFELDSDSVEITRSLEELVAVYGKKLPLVIGKSVVQPMNYGGTDSNGKETLHGGDAPWLSFTVNPTEKTYTIKATRNRDGQRRWATAHVYLVSYSFMPDYTPTDKTKSFEFAADLKFIQENHPTNKSQGHLDF